MLYFLMFTVQMHSDNFLKTATPHFFFSSPRYCRCSKTPGSLELGLLLSTRTNLKPKGMATIFEAIIPEGMGLVTLSNLMSVTLNCTLSLTLHDTRQPNSGYVQMQNKILPPPPPHTLKHTSMPDMSAVWTAR